MDRKLSDYLPSFVGEYREMKAIMDAEQPIFEEVWNDSENALADQFVLSATETGVERYEKILGIIPKGTYTLDERRFDVLARMNEQLPYTMTQLHNSLEALCGKDGYALKLETDAYKLTVKLALANENNKQAVEELLYKMLPANMVNVVLLFNTYSILSTVTHSQLAEHTHKEIREDIL